MNHQIMNQCALFAKEAYTEMDLTHKSKFKRTVLTVDNTSVSLYQHENVVFIAFRGTDDMQDWRVNAEAKVEEKDKSRTMFHPGFDKAYKEISRSLEDNLVPIFEQGASVESPLEVYVTGHSLGAALAIICANHIESNFITLAVKGVYTFAGPRVCYTHRKSISLSEWTVRLHKKVYRITKYRDIVPTIPLKNMGYFHVGTNYYIDRGNVIHESPSTFFKWRDSLMPFQFRPSFALDLVRYHDMNSYLKALGLLAV